MKAQISTITMVAFMTTQIYSQVSLGVRIGTSPTVTPGTSHLFVNRQDAVNESLFNIEQVRYSEQLGLMLRLDHEKFWFMSELMYGQVTSEYSMIYTQEISTGTAPMLMNEKRSYIEMPVSAGVSLGVVEVFSGLSAKHNFGFQSDLKNIEGFSSTIPALSFGWHTGLGVNLGHVLFDVRYQQEFCNYGEDRFINEQELLLKNSPGRFIVTAGFRI